MGTDCGRGGVVQCVADDVGEQESGDERDGDEGAGKCELGES